MGGGALKLEAAHLRLLPVPIFADEARRALDELGRDLVRGSAAIARVDEIVIATLSPTTRPGPFASAMAERSERLRALRRGRAAHDWHRARARR
jgi:hypothetical protein